MPGKKKSSKTKKKNTKSKSALQIVLWILFVLSLGALIITIIMQCKNSDGFTLKNDENSRSGNIGSCQKVLKDNSMNEFYPVLPTTKNVCNRVGKEWLSLASENDIQNLTVEKDGVRYMCNKSCPQVINASGLNSSGISTGVM